jgi:Na+-translocating ferredoxin:NAD+ oxidoreductase RnfG subunit
MRRLILLLAVFAVGCGNLSPRIDPELQQKIDNTNGKIGQIESIQNGIKSEIGKMQQDATISNSKLDKIQQGLLNFQSNYENSGIQIFSGPGGLLIGLFGMIFLTIIALHYRRNAIVSDKAAEILAQKVSLSEDPNLIEDVFQAAMYTDCEEKIYTVLKKNQMSAMKMKQNLIKKRHTS